MVKLRKTAILIGVMVAQIPEYYRSLIEAAGKWAEEQERLRHKAAALDMSVDEYLIRQELGIWDDSTPPDWGSDG